MGGQIGVVVEAMDRVVGWIELIGVIGVIGAGGEKVAVVPAEVVSG
jgi:hypothetical protein